MTYSEMAEELNLLIDQRIESYMKSIAYVKKAYVTVQSYDSTSKIAQVKFPNDEAILSYKNLSNDTLAIGDVCVVLYANGSNLSTGHIYGKLN
jgi:hypothetical protein